MFRSQSCNYFHAISNINVINSGSSLNSELHQSSKNTLQLEFSECGSLLRSPMNTRATNKSCLYAEH